MRHAKDAISGWQLALLMGAFVQGSILLIGFAADLTSHDTWLALLAGFVVTLPFVLAQAKLVDRFAGQTVLQIMRAVFGRFLGPAIVAYYLYYFTFTCIVNVADVNDFYTLFLQPDSPRLLFLAGFAVVCGFAVRKGLSNLGLLSHLFVATAAIVLIVTLALLAKDMDFSNFLPLFEVSLPDFLRSTHIISAIGFGELTVFLAVMGSVRGGGTLAKPVLLGMVIGGASLLLATIRNTAVLGPLECILVSPSFQVTRMIDYGRIFNRLDLLVGIAHTVVVFVKTTILLYATAVTLAELLGLKEYRPLVWPLVGLVVVAAAGMIRESSIIPAITTKSLTIIFQIPLIYIFPPLALGIARLGRLPTGRAGR